MSAQSHHARRGGWVAALCVELFLQHGSTRHRRQRDRLLTSICAPVRFDAISSPVQGHRIQLQHRCEPASGLLCPVVPGVVRRSLATQGYRPSEDVPARGLQADTTTLLCTTKDLILFPGDATFTQVSSEGGRTYVLRFTSSSARHFYWMQDVEDTQDSRRASRVNALIDDPQAPEAPEGDVEMSASSSSSS